MNRFHLFLSSLLAVLIFSAPRPAGAAPADQSPAVPATVAVKSAAQTPEAGLERALMAYRAGATEDARRELSALVEGGYLSASLAHNMGNVEYRRGNPGQAVLWYRRALALQPFSPETLQNLRTVRRQTAFVSFDPWLLSLSYLKPRWISTGTAVAAWTCLLLVAWLVWLTPRSGWRWPLVLALCSALPVLLAGAFLTWKVKHDPAPLKERHIVSGKETMAYAAPAEASSAIMALPAGSEVVPLETRGNWHYCAIPGGADDQPLRGWVRSAKLEILWPWAAQP